MDLPLKLPNSWPPFRKLTQTLYIKHLLHNDEVVAIKLSVVCLNSQRIIKPQARHWSSKNGKIIKDKWEKQRMSASLLLLGKRWGSQTVFQTVGQKIYLCGTLRDTLLKLRDASNNETFLFRPLTHHLWTSGWFSSTLLDFWGFILPWMYFFFFLMLL